MPAPKTKWEEIVDRAMGACVRTFGEGAGKVVYLHAAGGVAYEIDGIFEAQTEQVDLDTGALVMSNQPRISFRMDELQQIPNIGDWVEIRGKTYRVVEPMFDGQGTVTLRLHTS